MEKTAMNKLASDLRAYVGMNKHAQSWLRTVGQPMFDAAQASTRSAAGTLGQFIDDTFNSNPLQRARNATGDAAQQLLSRFRNDRFGNPIAGRENSEGSGMLGTALSAAAGMSIPEPRRPIGWGSGEGWPLGTPVGNAARSTPDSVGMFSPAGALAHASTGFRDRFRHWGRELFAQGTGIDPR